ncbi:hypothetical protein G039_0325315 [Pseudomonas aeruginosa VRFPA01]|nr:hypothetical protein G039_0325315 [Pseudomonas aeruginosa VRFPA01]
MCVDLAGHQYQFLNALLLGNAPHHLKVLLVEELAGRADDEHHVAGFQQFDRALFARLDRIVHAGGIDDAYIAQCLQRHGDMNRLGERHVCAVGTDIVVQKRRQLFRVTCLNLAVQVQGGCIEL